MNKLFQVRTHSLPNVVYVVLGSQHLKIHLLA
jgi:hypothetical protein